MSERLCPVSASPSREDESSTLKMQANQVQLAKGSALDIPCAGASGEHRDRSRDIKGEPMFETRE